MAKTKSEITGESGCPYCKGGVNYAGVECTMCGGEGTYEACVKKSFPRRCGAENMFGIECEAIIADPDHAYSHHAMTGC